MTTLRIDIRTTYTEKIITRSPQQQMAEVPQLGLTQIKPRKKNAIVRRWNDGDIGTFAPTKSKSTPRASEWAGVNRTYRVRIRQLGYGTISSMTKTPLMGWLISSGSWQTIQLEMSQPKP